MADCVVPYLEIGNPAGNMLHGIHVHQPLLRYLLGLAQFPAEFTETNWVFPDSCVASSSFFKRGVPPTTESRSPAQVLCQVLIATKVGPLLVPWDCQIAFPASVVQWHPFSLFFGLKMVFPDLVPFFVPVTEQLSSPFPG